MPLHIEITDDAYGSDDAHQLDDKQARAFERVLSLLRDLQALSDSSIWARVFEGTTVEQAREKWATDGITADDACKLAVRLRDEAFAEAARGEIPVELTHEAPCAPDLVMTVSAMLDHLAARLGPGKRARFVVEER